MDSLIRPRHDEIGGKNKPALPTDYEKNETTLEGPIHIPACLRNDDRRRRYRTKQNSACLLFGDFSLHLALMRKEEEEGKLK